MVGLCSKIYVCFNSFVIVLNRKILCFGSYHNPKYVFVNKSWTLFFLPLIEIVKAFSNQPSTILFVNTFHCKTQKQISSLKKKNPKRVIVSCKNKPNKVSKITCYTISQQNSSERQMLIKFFFLFCSQVCTQCGSWSRWPPPSRLLWARRSKDTSKTDTTWTSHILTNG